MLRGKSLLLRRSFALRPNSSIPIRWISKEEFNQKKSRSFFTSTVARAADVAVTQKDKKEEEIYEQVPWVDEHAPVTPEHQRSIPEFIKETGGGWFPFLAFFTVISLSKEWMFFHMGDFTLYAVNAVVWGGLYFLTADAIEEYGEQLKNEDHQRDGNMWELLTLSLRERIAIHKADIATEDFVKDLAHHWKASEIESARYGSLKAKHDARNEILAQLEAIARKEKAVQAAGTKVVAGALREHVRQQWATPDPRLKEQAFNLALNNLFSPQPIDPKASPVYGLYLNYLRGTKPTQKARA